MNDPLDPAIVETAARAGFAAAAANAAKLLGLSHVLLTWDEHLTDEDREHELGRTRAALSVAAPLIAAEALREAAPLQRGTKWLLARADDLESGQS